jgi:hypothetical protein
VGKELNNRQEPHLKMENLIHELELAVQKLENFELDQSRYKAQCTNKAKRTVQAAN